METLQRLHNRGSISTGYEIDNSLKVEADNSEYFRRTFSSAGTQTTGTVSFWIKRTSLGTFQREVDCSNTSGNSSGIFFESDQLCLDFGGAGRHSLRSQAKLRDTSAWYHCMAVWDTTQSTDTERTKLYINGSRVTSFSTATYPSQNATSQFFTPNDGSGSGNNCLFSRHNSASLGQHTPDGYHAEFHYIDGTAKTPSDFGEFDSATGIWKPKEYTGSHGSNGFYLDFADAANLGDDESGNGNDFTEVNITSADQATDTPTNNFCTLNFNTGYIQGSDATTFTQGATTRQGGSSSYNGALGTIGINPFVGSAKWYWEVELSANNSGDGIELGAGWLATSIIQSTTSDKATAGNNAGFQIWTSFDYDPPGEGTGADGDVFGFLLQCDSSNPNLKIYKNDTLFTTRHTATSYDFENDFYFPVVFIYNTGMKAFCNFGNPFDATVSSGNTDPNGYGNFEFDTKSGYALCTKNLAEYG